MRMMTHLSGESMRSRVARKDLAAGLGMDLNYRALGEAGLNGCTFVFVNFKQLQKARSGEHAAYFGGKADEFELPDIAHGGDIDADQHAHAGTIQVGHCAEFQNQAVLLVEQVLEIEVQLGGFFAEDNGALATHHGHAFDDASLGGERQEDSFGESKYRNSEENKRNRVIAVCSSW